LGLGEAIDRTDSGIRCGRALRITRCPRSPPAYRRNAILRHPSVPSLPPWFLRGPARSRRLIFRAYSGYLVLTSGSGE